MVEVRVVEAGEAHLDAIAAFFWEAWRMAGPDAPGWAGASEEVMDELAAPEALRARIGGPEHRMFLALEGDEVIAFAATRRRNEESVELAGIVVRQDRLGHGVGTPLLEEAVSAVTAAGFGTMVVRTEADNERALGFYRARGFDPGDLLVEEVEGISVEVRELVRAL
jgi:GNAT superfamily N-acetyltransferase